MNLKNYQKDWKMQELYLNEECREEFQERNLKVATKFLEERKCPPHLFSKEKEEILDYMTNIRQQDERVGYHNLNYNDNISYGFLSKVFYNLYRDTVIKHEQAIRAINRYDRSVDWNSKDKIQKDLFLLKAEVGGREEELVRTPRISEDTQNVAESSMQGSKCKRDSEGLEESSSKRPFEPEKINKSAIDYVLEKQQTEMPGFQDNDRDA